MPRARGPAPAAIVVLAPNWLGDAVMALPAIDDVRRAHPQAWLAVAARGAVAGLFRLVPSVNEVIDARAAALRGFDAALLLPNSFRSAWMVKRAGVPERWGYVADLRSPLLTRAIPKPKKRSGTILHQAEYYQRLTTALGMPPGPREPRIEVSETARAGARALLAQHGHREGDPLVVLAPGAAYGTAKQWIPSHVASLIGSLADPKRGKAPFPALSAAIVGSRADRATAGTIRTALPAGTPLIDLVGRTSLEQLAAVLACAGACVCNDSGAMHLAAAVGTPIVATFGPTDEHATAPVARAGRAAIVLTHDVWCRPCMLRECPIDHRCMTGITPDRVEAAVRAAIAG